MRLPLRPREPSMSDMLKSTIKHTVRRNITDEQENDDEVWNQIPFLPRFKTNLYVPHDKLRLMPKWLWRHAYKIDLDEYFKRFPETYSEPKPKDKSAISSSMKRMGGWDEVDVLKLSQERKDKLRAIALGELEEEKEEDE